MKFKKYFPYLIIALFATVACKKKETPIPTNPPVDVYTAGYVIIASTLNSVATYWKDSVQTALSDSTSLSQANAIAISGNDVYIAGEILDGQGNSAAICWKNGNPTILQTGFSSNATAIAVKGADVCIAGAIGTYPGHSVAAYWKNGVAIRLVTDTTSTSIASGIALNGNDVYIAGNTTGPHGTTATYWKNGVATMLTDTSVSSRASGIAVNGKDVYVIGTIGDTNMATYWKNGVPKTILSQYFSIANAVLISGNDVYITGTIGVVGTLWGAEGVFWKNDVITELPFSGAESAIAINGTDVYVAGGTGANTKASVPTYWKNGVAVHLGKKAGIVQGIALAPK